MSFSKIESIYLATYLSISLSVNLILSNLIWSEVFISLHGHPEGSAAA